MATETLEERVQNLENTFKSAGAIGASAPRRSEVGGGLLGSTPTIPILRKPFGLERSGAMPTAPPKERA